MFASHVEVCTIIQLVEVRVYSNIELLKYLVHITNKNILNNEYEGVIKGVLQAEFTCP